MSEKAKRIFPRIKANYKHEIYSSDEGKSFLGNSSVNLSIPKKFTPITDSIFEDIMISFIVDIGDKIEMHGDEKDMGMLTCGGNFEATIIFISGTWDHLFTIFGDEIAFCIPSNNLLFISKANNLKAISKMKAKINELFHDDDTRGLISKAIYLKKKGEQGSKIIDVAF